SRRCSQRWFRINLVLVAVMLIGSVITGYHYLIDGWAGIALAAGCWWAATRVSWRPDATAVAENECGVILSEAAE
ncbi:MAG TPA: phosphatase PAP2 family protein, partial [Thermoanaerobaculia bacterium]|nr:phosphatase PAP2 family protein [Thermoanaerobaculia bacterium]